MEYPYLKFDEKELDKLIKKYNFIEGCHGAIDIVLLLAIIFLILSLIVI